MSQEKKSGLGCYQGYSEPIYDGWRRYHCYVPVRDGTRLSVIYYIPTRGGKEAAEALPVVMHYSPYNHLNRKKDAEGRNVDTISDALKVMELIPYGYVYVAAQCRGTGASFGTRITVNSRQEARDGADLVEWLAAQPFCNGKVATAGQSYNGQTQLEILSQKPKHLTAAYIGKTDFNKYDGWVRNGVPRAFGSQPDFLWSDDEEEAKSQLEGLASATVPVDDDPEGILLRQAIWEHRGNGLQIPMLRDLNWRDSVLEELGGKVWEELSASTYHREMNESGVAVYLDGGCYDVFRRDTFVLYRNLALPRKMIFGPWYHIGPKSDPEPWVEMLRWFDYWLKGIDNGIVDEAPLALKVASYDFRNGRHQGGGTGEYRIEWEWPAENGHRETWYLDAAGTVGLKPGETGECSYEVVYGIQSSMESGTTVREDGQGVEQRGMVFTSEPLTENREIIGHPMAYLSFILENRGWMEKEKTDLDFFVILADWDPESETSYQISEGHLRASERENLADCPYDFLGLPWYENREGSNRYLKEGEIYHLTFDLLPLCYRVKKGHRLKMIISNSLDRMYYSGRLPYEQGKTEPAPVIRLLCGGKEDSRLVLPNIYQN